MRQFAPIEANDLVPGAFNSINFAGIDGHEEKRLLRTYVGEAVFFWKFLRPFFLERKPTEVLELGSGVGLLSLFASSEVKEITSIEPESAGFDAMSQLRQRILSEWRGQSTPIFLSCFLQDLPKDKRFDFIYAVNVLEHVAQPEDLLDEVFERLKPGGTAWFVFPNYSFPYEQHFEIPIFLSKRVTGKIFERKIRSHTVSPNPLGLWEELSWPTQRSLRKFLLTRGWSHEFRKNVLWGYFERLNEPQFIERKGALYRLLRPLLAILRPLVMMLPLGLAPIVELTISKKSEPLSGPFEPKT